MGLVAGVFTDRRRRSTMIVAGLAVVLAFFACCARAQDPLSVSDVWSRATAPEAPVGAVFMMIRGGASDNRLVAASVPESIADRVELHTHRHDAATGVMRMREVDGIDVPAGKAVMLKPGGLHIMLMGLAGRLEEGGRIPLTLVFESGEEISAEAAIMAAGAAGPMASDGAHHH